jgi:hypothetical protein
LRQGSLSSLCGLYSLINAIQLALYPARLPKDELQDLYSAGIGHLHSKRQLRSVLGVGMVEEAWLSLGAALVDHVNVAHGTSLKLRRVTVGAAESDRRRALLRVRQAIEQGSPVLASFGGTLDHYTVICGLSEQRLNLFDSSGLRWLLIRGVGVGEHSRLRHWISPQSALALDDDW